MGLQPVPEYLEYYKKAEGLMLQPYWDDSAKTPNVVEYSIGYGHQIQPHEQYLMNGITKAQAEQMLLNDIERYGKPVRDFIEQYIPGANDYMYSALLDLSFAAGPYGWPTWELGRAFKAGKSWPEIREIWGRTAITSMDKKTGKVIQKESHKRRRQEEIAWYEKGLALQGQVLPGVTSAFKKLSKGTKVFIFIGAGLLLVGLAYYMTKYEK